jgi:hypothetical protein
MRTESAVRKVPARLADWPTRLSAYLDARAQEPFTWGTHDCCLFAAGAIEAITGTHPAPHMVGAYDSALGARDHGIRPSPTDPFGVLGWPAAVGLYEIPVTLAWRGDVVAVRAERSHLALGVMVGDLVAAPGATGLAYLPRGRALAAWRV